MFYLRQICDRCGKEFFSGFYGSLVLKILKAREFDNDVLYDTERFVLCNECKRKLKLFLKNDLDNSSAHTDEVIVNGERYYFTRMFEDD